MHTKIKFFSTSCKDFEEVEKEVNSFCEGRAIIDIKFNDYKIMVIYFEGDSGYVESQKLC